MYGNSFVIKFYPNSKSYNNVVQLKQIKQVEISTCLECIQRCLVFGRTFEFNIRTSEIKWRNEMSREHIGLIGYSMQVIEDIYIFQVDHESKIAVY
jgi:hypothetical protein